MSIQKLYFRYICALPANFLFDILAFPASELQFSFVSSCWRHKVYLENLLCHWAVT